MDVFDKCRANSSPACWKDGVGAKRKSGRQDQMFTGHPCCPASSLFTRQNAITAPLTLIRPLILHAALDPTLS